MIFGWETSAHFGSQEVDNDATELDLGNWLPVGSVWK
jgi:hypothetical protein